MLGMDRRTFRGALVRGDYRGRVFGPRLSPMVAQSAKVDPHRSIIEVPEGVFSIYCEDDRYMVGRAGDGSLLGFFRLELTTKGHVVVRSHATGQLGLGTFDEARELLDALAHLAVEHGMARA